MRYHLDYYVFLLMVNKFFSCDLCYVKDVRLSAIWLVSAFMSHLLLRLFRVICLALWKCSVHRGVSDLCVFYLCLSRTFVSRFVVTFLVSRFMSLRRIHS